MQIPTAITPYLTAIKVGIAVVLLTGAFAMGMKMESATTAKVVVECTKADLDATKETLKRTTEAAELQKSEDARTIETMRQQKELASQIIQQGIQDTAALNQSLAGARSRIVQLTKENHDAQVALDTRIPPAIVDSVRASLGETRRAAGDSDRHP